MVIGFNNEFPIIATAMNSNDEKDRFPIVHCILKHENRGDNRHFYLEFSHLAGSNQEDKISEFEAELMKLIADESNFNLPYKMKDGFARFNNKNIIPGRKYILIPE